MWAPTMCHHCVEHYTGDFCPKCRFNHQCHTTGGKASPSKGPVRGEISQGRWSGCRSSSVCLVLACPPGLLPAFRGDTQAPRWWLYQPGPPPFTWKSLIEKCVGIFPAYPEGWVVGQSGSLAADDPQPVKRPRWLPGREGVSPSVGSEH